jgi:hypothetical protein
VLDQSARRLHVLALLYAFVFFMAGVFPALLFPSDRALFFSKVVQWGPSAVGIGAAGVLVAVLWTRRVSELPIPPALDDLILACLAKDPAQRPASAGELARRLDALDGARSRSAGWTRCGPDS